MRSRCCSRTACKHPPVYTLTYVYRDSTAVLGPLAAYVEPHCYDLCEKHAGRLTAPRGWDVVRLPVEPVQDRADDLEALANAVMETAAGSAGRKGARRPGGRGRPPGPPPGAALRAAAGPIGSAVPLAQRGAAPVVSREAGPALGDLASIVKAYDIRGVVPDQLDEGVAEAVGAAFARVTGAGDDRDHARHAHLLGPAGGRVRPRRGVAGGRRGGRRPGLDRHAVLRQRRPRHPRRDDHGQPQPVPLQRHQAVPRRGQAGRHPDRPERDQGSGRTGPGSSPGPRHRHPAGPAPRVRAST